MSIVKMTELETWTQTNESNRIHTSQKAKTNNTVSAEKRGQISCGLGRETVWQILDGDESDTLLGNQPQALQDTVGQPGVFADFESPEGVNGGYGQDWYSRDVQLLRKLYQAQNW